MTKKARIYNGEKTLFAISCAGTNWQLYATEKIRLLSNIMHKNKVKMGQIPKYKSRYLKNLRVKHR